MNPSTKVYHRRELLSQGAALAGLLAAGGLLPTAAQAAWNGAAFDAKSLPELIKTLGAATPPPQPAFSTYTATAMRGFSRGANPIKAEWSFP